MGPEHAARLAAGGAGGLGRGENSDASRDAGRARDRRPDAPCSGGAVDHRERSPARGAQDPALRRQAARARCRRRQRDRAEDQDAGQRTAARGRDRDGRASGAGPITRRAGGFLLQPFRDRDVAARRPRPVRRAGARRDLVSRRPADCSGLAGVAGDAGDGGRGFLQRHLGGAGFPPMDFSQRRPDREFLTAAGGRVDPARCGVLDRSRRRGPCDGEACRRARLFRPRHPELS